MASEFNGLVWERTDGKTWIRTNEGKPAVDEAIAYLQTATAVGALTWNDLLGAVSKAHTDDIGPKGLV